MVSKQQKSIRLSDDDWEKLSQIQLELETETISKTVLSLINQYVEQDIKKDTDLNIVLQQNNQLKKMMDILLEMLSEYLYLQNIDEIFVGKNSKIYKSAENKINKEIAKGQVKKFERKY